MKPTLPEPEIIDKHIPTGVVIRGYTAKTVRRLVDAAYAAGLEDAAKSCEGVTEWCTDATGCRYKTTAYDAQRCIAAIQALKS